MSYDVVVILWELLCIAVALVLLFAMRTVDCRLCRGAGQLALEATPPGEDSFMVDQDCVGCEGVGRRLLWR
jgi:hypothetical protein